MAVAEIITQALRGDLTRRIRGTRRGGVPLLASKIHQSDNVRELRRIWQVQDLPHHQFESIVEAVFAQRSPKGSNASRIGKDPLPGMNHENRAEKTSLAFQRFRIVDKVANLRIYEAANRSERPLSPGERRTVVDYLWEADEAEWADVAERLGIKRVHLRGTARPTELGERGAGKPPVNITDKRIRESKIAPLIERWNAEDEAGQEGLLAVITNGAGSGDHDDAAMAAQARADEFIQSLDENAYAELDNLKLPEGRAAYSARSMRLISERMMLSDDDLHAARKSCFPSLDDSWKPPADQISLPVGNPAVDRVLKIVARYLAACESQWGPPASVNIEHTRDGLMSEAQARKEARERDRNTQANAEARAQIPVELLNATYGTSLDDDEPGPARYGARQSDLYRYRAFQRQSGQCLYCGTQLEYGTFEMDHIVPRGGQGATNTQNNLAAVCRTCNHQKGKLPFAVWAQTRAAEERGISLEKARERADHLLFPTSDYDAKRDSYRRQPNTSDGRLIKGVRERLSRTEEDEELDNRSIESVGWMANELHHRVEAHYRDELKTDTTVGVFRGWITAEARKAAGIEDRLLLIGGKTGKNRLDRRHHAVDAATIALLRPGAAQVLVIRDNLRKTAQIKGPRSNIDWKGYRGVDTALFTQWQVQMGALATLIQDHLENDRVPVFEFLRLRLGSSQGHEDTIRPLRKAHVGEAWTVERIDRSATPAQWVALSRHPDFHPASGLAADPSRRVRIRGTWYEATDELEYFPTGTGCVEVRGGYAELGAFHHARIYHCTKTLKSGATQRFYSMLRVYQIDLLPYAHEDLFSVELPPQTISWRTAEQRLRDAVKAGAAEYIDWIVPSDEVLVDMSSQRSGKSGAIVATFGEAARRWSVAGFDQPSNLRLKPRLLAGEGLPPDTSDEVSKVLKKGWVVSVDVLFGKCRPTIIRRDVLGRPRLTSDRGLPVCWSVLDGVTKE
jgi:CRISPR-associated endonuclease Csn1